MLYMVALSVSLIFGFSIGGFWFGVAVGLVSGSVETGLWAGGMAGALISAGLFLGIYLQDLRYLPKERKR